MQENKNNKKKYLILLLIIIFLLITVTVIAANWEQLYYVIFADKLNIDSDAENWNGLDKDNASDSEEMQIAIPGYPQSIKITADEKNINIILYNPDENPCYFVFEIALGKYGTDDNGNKVFEKTQTLYQSKMVPPGKAISKETLNTAIAKGKHTAAIVITTYSLEDQTKMNGAQVITTLIAQ